MTENRLNEQRQRVWLWPVAFIALVGLTSVALAWGGGNHDYA